MKQLTLILKTPVGDELGRLVVPDVVVAAAGEAPGAVRPQLARDMDDLQDRVKAAVAEEGMEIDLSALELRIALSRVLVTSEDGAEPLLALAVRETAGGAVRPAASTGGQSGFDLLDGLFDLDLSKEDGDV